MKKTTKILLVLAAVVAMTIGAVSTVMAADTYPVIDSATWECTDGWYAKDTDGKQIETGWAVDAAGRYYYFSGKKALENAFIIWRGEVYYFGKDCIMCEGWVSFKPDNATPVLSIDLDGTVNNEVILDGDKENPYGKVVWCFFEKGGAAARNKWVDVDGLWYYFEDIVMISDTYAYYVAEDDTTYGFSGDGNMHVGWIKATGSYSVARPYESSANCWLYYDANGAIADLGWKKIEGKWYYFIANEAGSKYDSAEFEVAAGTPILLTNMFGTFDAEKNATFYVDGNGVMQTGVVTVAKNAYVRKTVADCLAGNNGSRDTSTAWTFEFKADGTMRTGAVGNCYYMTANNSVVYVTNRFALTDKDITTSLKANSFLGGGEKIFNAFRIDGSNVKYYDANGNIVKNGVVTFGQVTIAFDNNGNAKLAESPETGVYVAGRYYYFDDAFGTVTVGNIVIPGCSVRKLSTVSGSAVN